jgi:hypothetical protein
MLCELFLELNGWRNEASDAEALAAMLDLAAGDLDENGVAAWLPESCVEGWGLQNCTNIGTVRRWMFSPTPTPAPT